MVVSRLDRQDLPHLTVSWGNRSGEVDLHLTDDRSGDHRGIIVFSPASQDVFAHRAEVFAEEVILKTLSAEFRRYRPAWLAHRHYYVALHKKGEVEQWALGLATKQRKKWRLTASAFTDAVSRFPNAVDGLVYSASILSSIAPDEFAQPITAIPVRVRRARYAHSIQLTPRISSTGEVEWWGIPLRRARAIQRRFALETIRALKPHVDERHRTAFEAIVAGLALEDFDQLHQPIATIRSFLDGEKTAA